MCMVRSCIDFGTSIRPAAAFTQELWRTMSFLGSLDSFERERHANTKSTRTVALVSAVSPTAAYHTGDGCCIVGVGALSDEDRCWPTFRVWDFLLREKSSPKSEQSRPAFCADSMFQVVLLPHEQACISWTRTYPRSITCLYEIACQHKRQAPTCGTDIPVAC